MSMATESEIQGYFNKVGEALRPAGERVAAAYRAATRDGVIDAFLRQGANELGTALKAFPESVQIDEPGQVFNPLYSDTAADKRLANHPSPGDLAEGKGVEASEHSHRQGHRHGPSV
jgi:hypothetical protein